MTATGTEPLADPGVASRVGWRATPSGSEGGMRVLDFLLRRLPIRVAYVLVLPLVLMWFIHYNRPRVAVRRAMRRMGHRFTLLPALRAYLEYAFVLVERYYLRVGRLRPTMDQRDGRGLALIEEQVRVDGPLVFLGGHCGALEFGAAALEGLGRPVRAVAVRDPGAGALQSGIGDPADRLTGDRATIVADRSIGSGLKMLKALRAGEVLCFKADRVLPGAEDEAVLAPLFGEAAAFPPGPVKIALTARARAVVVSVFRVGIARYRVDADILDLSSRDPEAITAAYAASLERHVRCNPHHWFNFYPYWASDESEVEAHPEVVPLGARAAEHALWGGLAGSTALVLLDRVVGASLLWGAPVGAALVDRVVSGVGAVSWGIVAGILAAAVGIALGAQKQPDGRRNGRAYVQALLAPAIAVAGPMALGGGLVAAGVASGTPVALGAAAVWGAIIGVVGPRARLPALALVACFWVAGIAG